MSVRPRALALAVLGILLGFGEARAEMRGRAVLVPPVSPACVSSPFGPRLLPNQPLAGTYHYGIDLPAPEGAPVLAAAAGTVIRIQNKGPGGLEMLVQHSGFVGVYSHLDVVMPEFVPGKTRVAAGQQLGVVGNTGVTTGGHLYFEMILAGQPVDPAPFLGVQPCAGAVRQVQAAKPSADAGEQIGGRKYYLLPPPAGQGRQP